AAMSPRQFLTGLAGPVVCLCVPLGLQLQRFCPLHGYHQRWIPESKDTNHETSGCTLIWIANRNGTVLCRGALRFARILRRNRSAEEFAVRLRMRMACMSPAQK